MEQEKSVATKPDATAAVANGESLADWGQKKVSARDVVIPRILLMQHTTEKVKDEEAKAGEFRDTADDQVLGTVDKPLEFIPIHTMLKWVIYEAPKPGSTKKKVYLKTVPVEQNPALPTYNDDWKFEGEDTDKEGKKIQVLRDRVMDVFLLLPSELKTGGIPYVLGFRRTSYRAGKNLETQMYMKNAAAGKPPAARVMVLAGHKETDDDGNSFFVMDVRGGREATSQELVTAFKWYQMISGGKAQVTEDVETLEDIPVKDAKDVPHSNDY